MRHPELLACELVALLEDVQTAIQAGAYRITAHAADEMLDDNIDELDLMAAMVSGELIEDYPSAFPFPACLVLGWFPAGEPVHAVWALDATACYAFLVTVYRPDPARWTADFKNRVKR